MYEHVYEVRNRGFEEFERLPKDIFSECMDISFTVDIQGDRVLAFALRGVLIAYEPATGHLLLPTGAFDIGKGLTHLEFRFVTDRLSIEIYVNDGAFNTAVCQPLQPFETEKPLGAYKLVIVGSPVWAGRCASPIRALLKRRGLEMENVAYVVTRSTTQRSEEVYDQMDMYTGQAHRLAVSLRPDSEGYEFWRNDFIQNVRRLLENG